jgi:hypothetical protein
MDPTLFAAAIVTVLAALFGGVIQLVNAVSAARDRRDAREERKALREQSITVLRATEATGLKADTIIEKAVEIHTLTNSANAKLQAALELVTEKLAAAERTINRMEATMAAGVSDRAIAAALLTPVPHDRRADDTHDPITVAAPATVTVTQ